MQKSLDANISLVHCITLACLVWLWSRKESSQSTGSVNTAYRSLATKELLFKWNSSVVLVVTKMPVVLSKTYV